MKNHLSLLVLLLPSIVFSQMPTGFVAEYPLDNNLANDISTNHSNGTLTSSTSVTNRFGVASKAVSFVSGTSYGEIPVVVTGNFSLGYWMKSSMTANSGTQWYSGNSLVDAEVCGVVNDWGTALINGGKIAFGTGNPDITITSPLSYNDGNWHYVTVTHSTLSTGNNILYVDGNQVASTTGVNTGTLNAPSFLGFGRNNCSGADYTGALDDIVFYNYVLTSTQVTNLYNYTNSTVLPVQWLSFNANLINNGVELAWTVGNSANCRYFEISRSTSVNNFVPLDTISMSSVNAGANTVSESYFDASPTKGRNLYRIKEVDLDGEFIYSSIASVDYGAQPFTFSIQNNPIQNNWLILLNPGQMNVQGIRIFDVSGKMVKNINNTAPGSTTIGIDVSELLKGYYFVQVLFSNTSKTLSFSKL